MLMPDSKEIISITYQCIDIDNAKKNIRFSLLNHKTLIKPKLKPQKFLESTLKLAYTIGGDWEAVIPQVLGTVLVIQSDLNIFQFRIIFILK
jgi:hypothetical protein